MAHPPPRWDLGPPEVPACPECGASLERTLVRIDHEGVLLGYFPADRCDRGHEYLAPESYQAVAKRAKDEGVWASRTAITGVPPPPVVRRLVRLDMHVHTSVVHTVAAAGTCGQWTQLASGAYSGIVDSAGAA